MKALLLAAGYGTRLRPFTFERAKATLPFQQLPFIHFPLQYLAANGVGDVVINLHAHPDSVQHAVSSFRSEMRIHYSFEPAILGTAGAIRKAAPMMDTEFFVVMNSDMLTDIPLDQVIQQHRNSGALVTLVVMNDSSFGDYSGLYFDGDPLRLIAIQNGPGEKYHYTGLQIVSQEVVTSIPENRKSEVFTEIYPKWMAEGKIHGFRYDGFWKEIGTLRHYLNTSIELCREALPAHLEPQGALPILVSPKATIEPESNIMDSIVMEGATVRSGSELERCIIGWNVTASGRLRNTALARGILPWHII